MRALLLASIKPIEPSDSFAVRYAAGDDKFAYDERQKAVIELFEEIGFDNLIEENKLMEWKKKLSPEADDLNTKNAKPEEHPEEHYEIKGEIKYKNNVKITVEQGAAKPKQYIDIVNDMFEGTPEKDGIRFHEQSSVVMLGTLFSGQVFFVVSLVNQTELHIRLKCGLFKRTKWACKHLIAKIDAYNKRVKSNKKEHKPVPFYLELDNHIQVMEPGNDHATITGKIFRGPWKAMISFHLEMTIIVSTSLFFALMLFFYHDQSVAIAQPIVSIMKSPLHIGRKIVSSIYNCFRQLPANPETNTKGMFGLKYSVNLNCESDTTCNTYDGSCYPKTTCKPTDAPGFSIGIDPETKTNISGFLDRVSSALIVVFFTSFVQAAHLFRIYKKHMPIKWDTGDEKN
ncbi:MAG: hypothetical protein L7F77_14640 [Candidatus Magnetominusculus sp. LBB02]|nr:hypothetical protein [Candidatus Magnetominusculus sp. LBB02]